jgi:hypothetical protein
VNSTPDAGRRLKPTLAGVIALASMLVVLAISGTHEGHAEGTHHNTMAAKTQTTKQVAVHDAMRKLWEDHITWTRLAIVSFAADLPDFDATAARLLANQDDIGNAIKPYYGRAAGNTLTKLLKDHILGAVTLMKAAKSGDSAAITKASDDWYANGNQIAEFLHSANPHNWSRQAMRKMMRVHLDQTLSEAQHRLQGNHVADVRDYDAIHHHILQMADMLSAGIIHQFPRRFR